MRFPSHYRRANGAIENLVTGERFDLAAWSERPLELAGRLVQEDLCLMQKDTAGYRLVAAVLCFPAHWRLADKLGRPLVLIHEPVPGFAERLAPTVDRFFANLAAARPVWRANWSLVDTDERFLPPEHRKAGRAIAAARVGEELWLRVERQTFRRLPRSGDVLFGIRTYVEPLATAIDDAAAAAALAARIGEMPDAMARYKGIAPIREPLLAWLAAARASGAERRRIGRGGVLSASARRSTHSTLGKASSAQGICAQSNRSSSSVSTPAATSGSSSRAR